MSIRRRFLMVLLALFATQFALRAQNNEPVTVIDGKQYYVHKVNKGETLWGLSKTYNVSVDDLVAANPEAAAGLRADAVINIPVAKKTTAVVSSSSTDKPSQQSQAAETQVTAADDDAAEPVSLSEKLRHEVQKGETIYGISRRYGVTEQELIGMNPGIESGLRAGQILVLPASAKEQTITENTTQAAATPAPTPTVSVPIQKVADSTYKVRRGENLYDIARRFGVDIADIKAANQGLTNYPIEGLPIVIPQRKNKDDFFVHRVEQNEKTATFVNR